VRFALILLCACVGFCQTPAINRVTNLSNDRDPICPGSLVYIYGNFGSGSNDSASVVVNGKAAAVITAAVLPLVASFGPGLILAQLAWDTPPGPASITVEKSGAKSAPFPLRIENYGPYFLQNPFGATNEQALFVHNETYRLVLPSAPASPGDNLLFLAIGIGPIDRVIPPGTPPPPGVLVNTVSKARLTVGCSEANVQFSGLYPSFPGFYQVNFAVPANLSSGSQPAILETGGKTARAILPLKGLPFPWICSVVNGATLKSPGVASPGSIVSIRVTNVGEKEGMDLFPGVDFQSKSVTFNGVPAPLFAVSGPGDRIDALVPFETPTSGAVAVKVANEFGLGDDFMLQMAAAAPGIYRLADPSNPARSNANAVLAGTSWLAIPTSMAAALKLPADCSKVSQAAACGQPVKPGDVVQLVATGLGLATPDGDPNGQPLATGSVAPADASQLYSTVDTPAVTVGSVAAEVLYSGIVPGYAGRYQVQFRIPDSAPVGDDVPIALNMPGSATDSATIAIRH
jgi:uncharacterized protein (TIGR03437 family)